jgi:16S rRNA C967 or C1407 C5-methylase (RsmB/RsmF family)
MELAEVKRLFERYRESLGDLEWHEMCSAFSRPLPSTFWTNQARQSSSWIAESFQADEHEITPIPYVDGGYKSKQTSRWGRRFEFRAGLIHLQEAASMLPPLVLRPQPGELVLDLCAAPGGKSAQLSLQMENTGTLVVNDLSFGRLRALRATQERLGLRNMVLCAQRGEELLRDHPPVFDKVLVDAPCSCEGTLRKRGRWSFEQYNEQFKQQLIETQRALLMRALRLTRPGGRVVYSTCTLDPDENEGVIASALEEWTRDRAQGLTHVDVSLEALDITGLHTSPGLTSWRGTQWSQDLTHALRVYPHHNDTGGFFIASLRISESPSWSPHTSYQSWSQPERLHREDSERLYAWTEERYDVDLSQWSQAALTQSNTRLVSAINTDLRVPPTRYQTAGLPMFYTRGAIPRLTSAAALEWGRWATRGVIELESRAQVDEYYRGEHQRLARSQIYPSAELDLQHPPLRGVSIIRYQGVALGLGYLSEVNDEVKNEYLLKSEYPQRIKLSADRSAFEPPLT